MRQVYWMTLFRKGIFTEELKNLPFEIVQPHGKILGVVLSPDDERLKFEPKPKSRPTSKAPSAMFGPHSG